MQLLYTFLISFSIVFFSELGDKTQLLVLSFASKNRIKNILLGVALGTFFSHGLAIIFGSKISSFQNESFKFYLQIFTYSSFLLFGLYGFFPKKKHTKTSEIHDKSKFHLLEKLSSLRLNYIVFVALSIFVGEIGDKTFLASLGLGLEYSNYKVSLILGSICGMVFSNAVALFFGKILRNFLNPKLINTLSNLIFIFFGVIGFLHLLS